MLKHDTRKTRQSKPLTLLLHVYPILIISFMLLNISCSRQITETEPIDNTISGRRDYIWTVDTITTDPFVNLSRMWGSGPNDLWAVGGCLYHFNGTSWSQLKGYYPEAIFGFAQNDVWAVCNGKKAQFWHYNGVQWSLFSENYNIDSSYIVFNNIWGDSPSNIYAVGFSEPSSTEYKQLIMHYDGKNWNSLKTQNIIFNINEVRTSGNKIVMTGEKTETAGSTYKVLEFDGTNTKELYQGSDHAEMSSIGSDIYIYIAKRVYKYSNGGLVLFEDWSNYRYIGGFFARSERDAFLCILNNAGFYTISHYNGENIAALFNLWSLSTVYYGSQLFNESVCFLGCDYNTGVTFCIHGKLPN